MQIFATYDCLYTNEQKRTAALSNDYYLITQDQNG